MRPISNHLPPPCPGLFTADWALRHVCEPAFPGVLAYNERPTADEVVRIELEARYRVDREST